MVNECQVILHMQKTTFYNLETNVKRKVERATQFTSLAREVHRPNPFESWLAASFLCDMNFLYQA